MDIQEEEVKRPRSRDDVVKVGFYSNYKYAHTNNKNLRCNIFIGNEIIKELKWKINDNIKILKSKDNSYFKLIKCNEKTKNTYKLRTIYNSAHAITIPFCWEQEWDKEKDNIKENYKKIKTVNHEIYIDDDNSGCLKVFINMENKRDFRCN